MNKYTKITEKPYNIKSWICFIGLIIALLISCFTLLLDISENNKLIIQIFTFILADLTIFLKFCCIESNFVFDYARKNNVISELSRLRLVKAIDFNKILKLLFILITILSISITLFIEKINNVKLVCLTLQIIYILPFVIYNTYFLKLITAFSEKNYLTDLSVISYDKISNIIHKKTFNLCNVDIEEFDIISNQIVVGTYRLVSSDYNYLLEKIMVTSYGNDTFKN